MNKNTRLTGAGLAMLFSLALACSCNDDNDLKQPSLMPQFELIWADGITANSARMCAVVSGGGMLDNVRFDLLDRNGSLSGQFNGTFSGDTVFAVALGLESNSEYRFQAFGFNGLDDSISSTKIQFVTLSEIPDTPDEPDTPDNPYTPYPHDEPYNPSKIDYVTFECDFVSRWFMSRYDTNSDGKLSMREIWDVSHLDFNGDIITSVRGLELLPNLKHLCIQGSQEPDVRGTLQAVDLTWGWPNLCTLLIFNSCIDNIDLSVIGRQFKGFQARKCLLKEIDVSVLTETTYIDLAQNMLSELDFSGLDQLDELHIEQNPGLEKVTFNNKVLRYVDLNNTAIHKVDFSKCPRIDAIDLTGCSQLDTVVISRKQVINTITKPGYVKIVYCD